jgi:prevent-host-death family protein
MKTTSLRDFSTRIAELVDDDEPVLVTRDGKAAAVLYPLRDPKKLPLEIRRQLFLELTTDIAKQLEAQGVTEEDIEREFTASRRRRGGR